MSGNDTTISEGALEKLKVWLLEKSFSGTLRVAGVRDDDIKLVFLVLQELESITNDDLHIRMVEANRHAR